MASKGGLVRIVGIPDDLADRLEERRLGEPVRVTDRGVHYRPHGPPRGLRDGVLVDAMEPNQGVEDEQAQLDALDGLVQALPVVSVARRHGIAPVRRSHPACRYMRDGDGDGVVGE